LSAREAIGVDLGGTKMAVGVMDSDRQVHYEGHESSVGRTEDQLVEDLAREIGEAREARPDAVAAGLGIPCTIDRERGIAIAGVNLPITDVPIRDLMTERLGMPVFIDNDANCAALAEHRFGASRGADNAVLLTVGTGIGGGLIIGGELYRGSTGAGAELGHMVIQLEGPKCQGACPSYGCAEVLASGTALGRYGAEAAERYPDSALGKALAAGTEFNGRIVVEAAQAGDQAAVGVLEHVGRHLGAHLTGLANAFDPDVIVIGGGVSAAGDLLLGPAREELSKRALPPMNKVQVVRAELGPAAGMIGAATMALEESA
jgi:glucokinase